MTTQQPQKLLDEVSVWSTLQLILKHYETPGPESAVIIEGLLLELQNEPTIKGDIVVALQYWRGCGVARKGTRLIDYRINRYWKYMDRVQELVYSNPVRYGGPEIICE